jgi:predicted nucleic acid-binding protein
MSADVGLEFVDTNILIYALDSTAGAKRVAAAALLERLWTSGTGCLSVQVLQEFAVVATRKLPAPLTTNEVVERVSELSAWRVFSAAAADVVAAVRLASDRSLPFWDAMIVVAAIEQGCSTLWTEALSDGQSIGGVHIRNPFTDLITP